MLSCSCKLGKSRNPLSSHTAYAGISYDTDEIISRKIGVLPLNERFMLLSLHIANDLNRSSLNTVGERYVPYVLNGSGHSAVDGYGKTSLGGNAYTLPYTNFVPD